MPPPQEEMHLQWKPEHSWKILDPKRTQIPSLSVWKAIQLQYDSPYYYPQQVKNQVSIFPQGSWFLYEICVLHKAQGKLKEPLLVGPLPICLRFPIHFRLAEILRGALGLWSGKCRLQGVHDGIDNDLQKPKVLSVIEYIPWKCINSFHICALSSIKNPKFFETGSDSSSLNGFLGKVSPATQRANEFFGCYHTFRCSCHWFR